MKKHTITIGADPEIFIKNNKEEIVSAEGLTKGGTKENPKAISEFGHAIQEDGIMFEYNIPPCKTESDWVDSHTFCIDYLSFLARANGYELSNKVSSEINPIYLQSIQAKTFGCEPDWNVYLKDTNPIPDSNTNLRCAGGHVAIGYVDVEKGEESDFNISEKMVLIFDMFLTLPALFKDNDTRRRELYGKAGSFRVKDWGVECRALSNFWIHSEENMKWVFQQTLKVANLVLENETHADELIEKYSNKVRETIDSNNLELASVLLEEINEFNLTLV
jgi:hypothetical protein